MCVKERMNTYVVLSISFQIIFVQVFKIVVGSWKFSMILLYSVGHSYLSMAVLFSSIEATLIEENKTAIER